ncbi:sensor histidine kinase [Streptomyces phaeoluteigriseus]|uniref:sensor histidine kinase n=1 Tax=Streptomyces phaeoluteigriseus TaxID=114686 RepID=UPI00338DDAF6
MSTTKVDAPSPRLSASHERHDQGGPRRSAASSVRRGLRGFADRWPFQRKLNVLVGVPLTVIALLLTWVISDLLEESDHSESAAQLVRDSAQVAQLVADVQAEHQQAVLLSVRYEASFDGGTPSTSAYRIAQLAVDTQIQKVREAFGDRLPDTEAVALREIEGLAGLRDTIEQGYLPADNIDPAYSGAADGLIDGLGLDHDASLATTFTGSLLDSLLRADAAHGAYETGVFSARTGDSNALIEFTGAVGSHELYTYQADRFARFATEAQTDLLGDIEHNAAQAVIGQHYAELAVDPSALQAESREEIRTAFREALDSYHHYNEQAETRLRITGSLIDQIADRADDAAASAEWRAGLLLSLALLGFAVWIGLAALVRRSVIRPVLALTGAAQEVADVAGRELARVADDDAEESGPPRLRELPVTADDEIGALAEALNNVQTTAAALLERQVLSRRNVAEMFGNVGRRVSNLTTRQLALIDAVERGETDPALLERLYSIDHIAVRLRRNADSLMLLAGIRETVLDSGPAALTNVVRAALGQIEGFQRVQLYAGTEVLVEPDIIGDLTLMIAELLENAVSFSPTGSPVEVRVRPGDDGATITVADHGLGMSAERLAEENARLVRRERLDLVPTKVLGLFVVGALARRWDIDVTLTRTPGGGVTAEVSIPSTLLLPPSGAALQGAAPATAVLPPGAKAALPSGTTAGTAPGATATALPGTPDSPTASAPAPIPAGGPSRAASVPAWAAAEDQDPLPLPRRVPRRESAEAGTDAETEAATGAETGVETKAVPGVETGVETEAVPGTDAETEAVPGIGTEAVTEAKSPLVPGPRPEEPTVHDRTAEPAPHVRTEPDGTEPAGIAVRREPRADAAAAGSAEPTARPRAHDAAHHGGSPTGPAAGTPPDGARPLRRRVRGATLRTTAEAAARQSARLSPPPPADADAVRSALEEFEAAVERAHRDTGEHPRPTTDGPALRDGAERDDGTTDHRTDRPTDDRSAHRADGRTDHRADDDRNTTHRQNHLPEGAEQ